MDYQGIRFIPGLLFSYGVVFRVHFPLSVVKGQKPRAEALMQSVKNGQVLALAQPSVRVDVTQPP